MRANHLCALAACLLAAASSACERSGQVTRVAEPLATPSYGEEQENPEVFVDTMEVGSRELYAAREAVLGAAKIAPGARIADIGAGTGLYSLMFADRTGVDGVVYAIDIEARFLKLINQRAADLDLRNVVAVLGRQSDVTLPPNSVDVAFIADTYHYFTDSAAIMASVRDALGEGGRLIVVDYNLDAANAADARRSHVRFGKAGLVTEVESFGFKLIDAPAVDGLNEFYMAVFVKSAAPAADPRQP